MWEIMKFPLLVDTDQAEYYFKKLMKITVAASVAWNVIIFAATPLMLMAYDLSAETKGLVIWLVVIHNVFNAFAYPFWGRFRQDFVLWEM